MKKISVVYALVIACVLSILLVWPDVESEIGYTGLAGAVIDGNAVYTNDSNVYISAHPHIISSSGWVYFNLTSKVYSGDIDVVFGFNTTQVKPTRLELYSPHTVEWNTTHYKTFYNVSSFNDTTAPCDYGFEYNTFKKNGTYDEALFDENETLIWKKTSAVVCYDSFSNLGNNTYGLTWHQQHSRIEDYIDKTSTLTSVDYNFGGMNKWWYAKNVPITANTSYMVRSYVQVPVQRNESFGKYWFAIKPSSETIQEAILSGHLYYLDPWWNTSWSYCKNVTISSVATSTLTNFPVFVNVTYVSGKMQSDYDDIRFINDSCDGAANAVELDYEFVENDSTAGEFWVRIPSLPSSGINISMYYGNAGASSGENPASVWSNNYTLVAHMLDNDTSSVLDSTSFANHGTKTGANDPKETTGRIYHAQEHNISSTTYIDFGHDDEFDVTDAITLEAWAKPGSATGTQYILGKSWGNPYMLYYGPHLYFSISNDSGTKFYAGLPNWLDASRIGNWYYFAGTWDKNIDAGLLKLYVNGSEGGYFMQNSSPTDMDVSPTDPVRTGSHPNQYNGTIDEVRVSNVTRTADWINMSYQTVVDQTNLVTWAGEEATQTNDYTWAGGTGIWENAANWIPNTDYPRKVNDGAFFNGSVVDCNTTGALTIGELNMTTNYTGTITLGAALTIDDAGVYDGNLTIMHTNAVLDGNASSLTVDGSFLINGTYDATSGTTLVLGNTTIDGTWNTPDNAVVNVTNVTHNGTTNMGDFATWYVYGEWGGTGTLNAYLAGNRATLELKNGSKVMGTLSGNSRFIYSVVIPDGAYVEKYGSSGFGARDGSLDINGTCQIVSGTASFFLWSLGNNIFIGPNANVSTFMIDPVGSNTLPESTWRDLYQNNGGTLTLSGNLSFAGSDESSSIRHYGYPSYGTFDLNGYSLIATGSNHNLVVGGSSAHGGGKLLLNGGNVTGFNNTYVGYADMCIINGSGGGLFSTNNLELLNGTIEMYGATSNISGDVVIMNGTFIGGSGNHTSGSLTVNSDGTYNATSGTTLVLGNTTIDGIWDTPDNAVVNITNVSHDGTTYMGDFATWYVYGEWGGTGTLNAYLAGDRATLVLENGSKVMGTLLGNSRITYSLVIPDGAYVEKYGGAELAARNGNLHINGTYQYVSGTRTFHTWSLTNNIFIGPNANVSTIELKPIGSNTLPASTWWRLYATEAGTLTLSGNLSVDASDTSSHVWHYSYPSYTTLDLNGYSLIATGSNHDLILGYSARGGARLLLNGGNVTGFNNTDVRIDVSVINGSGGGSFSANTLDLYNGTAEMYGATLNISGDVVLVDATFIGGSGNHTLGSLTVNSGGTYNATTGNTSTGTVTINAGGIFTLNNGSTIDGSGSPTTVTNAGTWNWNNCSLQDLDLQWDVTTPGSGYTVEFIGDMTIDAFTASSGDTLKCVTPGTTITGANSKFLRIYDTINFQGASGNRITVTGQEQLTIQQTADNITLKYCDVYSDIDAFRYEATSPSSSVIEHCSFHSNSWSGVLVITAPDLKLVNCTLNSSGGSGAYDKADLARSNDTGANPLNPVILDNCTFVHGTVGFRGPGSGGVVAKDYNRNQGEWKYWGVMDTGNASSGYRASDWNNGNITISNADYYTTAFNTSIILNETGVTAGNITIDTNTTLTANTSVNFTANGDVNINGTLNGTDGNYSFGSLTVNTGGIYTTALGTTILNGDFNISGDTTWNNCTIKENISYDGEFGINVLAGGTLTITNNSYLLFGDTGSVHWDMNIDAATSYSFDATTLAYGNNTGATIINATDCVNGGNNVPLGMWNFGIFPNVTINYPTAGNYSGVINIYTNVTDEIGVNNNSVYFWFENYSGGVVANQTDWLTLYNNSNTWNFTSSYNTAALNDGYYNITINASDLEGNANTTEKVQIVIDNTGPVVNWVGYVPNTTDDIDPGTNINVTANVTDTTTFVDNATLQYKKSYEANWISQIMVLLVGGLYTGNFTTAVGEDPVDYIFRIFANDSLNNTGNSSNTTITSATDKTWTVTPNDFGNVSLLVTTTGNLVNMTINNTGDYTMAFTIVSDWPTTTYNRSVVGFSIASGAAELIEVNVTAALVSLESPITITTTCNSVGAVPTSDTTNGTLISYAGGPYFLLDIATYPLVSYQSSNVTLQATIQNVGNETAENTTLNWTLPIGWTNVSGAVNYSIGNISSSTTWTANLTAYLPPGSATAGTRTIYVNASGVGVSNNTNDSTSEQTILLCNGTDGVCGSGCTAATDADCSTTPDDTTGGGGGGGGGAGGIVEFTEVKQTVELISGKTNAFQLLIRNIFPGAVMNNVTISVEGFLIKYIKIDTLEEPLPDIKSFSPSKITAIKNPLGDFISLGTLGESPHLFEIKLEEATENGTFSAVLDDIAYNQTKAFYITIEAPAYMEESTYTLVFTIRSIIQHGKVSRSFIDKRTITLEIYIISREEAQESLTLAIQALEELDSLGVSTLKVQRLLKQANESFEEKDYEGSFELSQEIIGMRNDAFAAYEEMSNLEEKTNTAIAKGIDVSKTLELLYLAQAAFERGAFDLALERVKEAESTYSVETKGEITVTGFLIGYWWLILVVAGILMVSGTVVYRRSAVLRINKKLASLSREANNLHDLREDTQRQCFEEGTLSESMYHKAMYEYDERTSKIKAERAGLISKRVGIVSPEKENESLKSELKRLNQLIREAQDDYYVKETIAEDRYERRMEEYTLHIAEAETNLASVELIMADKKMNPSRLELIKKKLRPFRRLVKK